MNRGCLISLLLVILAVAIAGYFAYDKLKVAFETPQELLPYVHPDSMLARVRSKAPAPAAGVRLTAEQVQIFVGALDSVNSGWDAMSRALDSLNMKAVVKNDSAKVNYWASPYFILEFRLLPLRGRKSLVTYLNEKGVSWAEYLWIKERVVGASGIRHEQVDSVLESVLVSWFAADSTGRSDSMETNVGNDSVVAFYARLEALRASGAIDSAETALVLPYRETILARGLLALLCIETNFKIGLDLKVNRSLDEAGYIRRRDVIIHKTAWIGVAADIPL